MSDFPNAYIFDIDGTLALTKSPTYEDIDTAPVNAAMAYLLNLINHDITVDFLIIISARPAKYRDRTIAWLWNNNLKFDHLFMREDGDEREDHLVKFDIYKTYVSEKYTILGSFDDKEEDITLWRVI